MSGLNLGGVNRSTLREQVKSTIRAAILDGTLSAGTRLAEVDLSEQLGVSRGTVREALRSLQESGLVDGEERSGLRVVRLGPQEVYELFQVRAALEGLAVELIVDSPRAEEIADQLETALPQVPAGSTIRTRLDVDLGFHEELIRAAGSSVLLGLWSQLKDQMRVAVLFDTEGENSELMEASYHYPIVQALRSGDPVQARSVIVAHMNEAARRWAIKATESGA